MFESRTRSLVFTQADHARMAAHIALHWGNDLAGPLPLPRASFARGVEIHDRGYGETDTLAIGRVPEAEWLAVQRRGIELADVDTVADVVALMHLRRLVASAVAREAGGDAGTAGTADPAGASAVGNAAAILALADERIAAGVAKSGHPFEAFTRADTITALCDMIAFYFCFDEAHEFSQTIITPSGPLELTIGIEPGKELTIEPWPLDVPRLGGEIRAYRRDGYPAVLEPEPVSYRIRGFE